MAAGPSSDLVSHLLQQTIAARHLVPGDRLGTEAELARDLNVTRPAVREAVRLLVRANLLRAVRGPGGGVFVAHSPDGGLGRTISAAIEGMLESGATSLPQLTEIRLLLEVPLAGLAAERADPAAIAALHEAIADAERDPADIDLQRETDMRFHRTIGQAAGNGVGSALTAWCSEVLQPVIRNLVAPAIVEAVAREQHREIVVAIESRRAALAERAMRAHLQYLTDLLETVG
jgi:DNA-binding FadR family transcriptional regulator